MEGNAGGRGSPCGKKRRAEGVGDPRAEIQGEACLRTLRVPSDASPKRKKGYSKGWQSAVREEDEGKGETAGGVATVWRQSGTENGSCAGGDGRRMEAVWEEAGIGDGSRAGGDGRRMATVREEAGIGDGSRTEGDNAGGWRSCIGRRRRRRLSPCGKKTEEKKGVCRMSAGGKEEDEDAVGVGGLVREKGMPEGAPERRRPVRVEDGRWKGRRKGETPNGAGAPYGEKETSAMGDGVREKTEGRGVGRRG